jgi:hypothetical protein
VGEEVVAAGALAPGDLGDQLPLVLHHPPHAAGEERGGVVDHLAGLEEPRSLGEVLLLQHGDHRAHGVRERGEGRLLSGAAGQLGEHGLLPVDVQGEGDVLLGREIAEERAG